MSQNPQQYDENPVVNMVQNIISRMLKDLSKGQLNFDSAVALLARQIEVAEKINNLMLKGRVYQTMGIIESERNHYSEGLRYFTESLKAYQASQDQNRIATILCCLGEVHRHMGNVEEAAQYFTESRQLSETIDNQRLVIYNMGNEGQLWLEHGEIARAVELLEKGLELVKDVAWNDEIVYGTAPEMMIALADAYVHLGNYALAWTHVSRGLELAQQRDQVHQMAHAHQTMARIAQHEGKPANEIAAYYAKSRQYWIKMGSKIDLGRMLILEGDFWQTQGDLDKSRACYLEASECLEQTHHHTEAEDARRRLSMIG